MPTTAPVTGDTQSQDTRRFSRTVSTLPSRCLDGFKTYGSGHQAAMTPPPQANKTNISRDLASNESAASVALSLLGEYIANLSIYRVQLQPYGGFSVEDLRTTVSRAMSRYDRYEAETDMIAEDDSQVNTRTLAQISVRQLFGRYDYDLPAGKGSISPELGILYGGNGTGKTTILHLVHHMLSVATVRGHKTEVAQVPFKSMTLTFSDGLELQAARRNSDAGTFTMRVVRGNDVLDACVFEVIENRIPGAGKHSERQDQFLYVQGIALNLYSYLLTDDRKFDSDLFPEPGEGRQVFRERFFHSPFEIVEEDSAPRPVHQLELAIDRAVGWAKSQALSGADVGSQNASTVYGDVVTQLASHAAPDDTDIQGWSTTSIIDELNSIAERSTQHSRFGLPSSPVERRVIDALMHLPSERQSLVVPLLKPYVEALQARLDAQDLLYRTLDVFTSTLNRFLYDKEVTFDLRKGIVVRLNNRGVRLSPNKLSSGERQLMTLLCNLLFARQHSSLFIIDEPEISLNIVWQRDLIPALLECTAGSNVQFLLATHSIELLARYRKNVMQLATEPLE